ncbi:MAG: hypothetical protein C4520_13065 [Candidatus Abyssobacteria bacterium SURF_5]|uniref:Uncharacterized protein n=1 Tax=Abyssobacteria bacterium (strain SURF_5) TaxID=2093360 RepID=A0A3A4NU46_ABYX5|nr:MAG: hypothetical protein C4520_13065 [Candidatus Abyssubacteria bacterium SURF_5]
MAGDVVEAVGKFGRKKGRIGFKIVADLPEAVDLHEFAPKTPVQPIANEPKSSGLIFFSVASMFIRQA